MSSQIPYREIRAHYDDDTITVYQAYSSSIAESAVAAQRLDASPDFKMTRMTWVKPSWAWMMYRSGYSCKDKGQSRILALKMKHEHFKDLLSRGVLSTHAHGNIRQHDGLEHTGPREKTTDVRIQWDPERTPKLGVLPYRSIQIGIPGALSSTWISEWIVRIDDVTDRALALKQQLEEQPDITGEELAALDLMPAERPFAVSDAIRERLKMT
jgi:hypothetical protein